MKLDPDVHSLIAKAVEDVRPPTFSDDALALRFTARHGIELRYVAAWSRWLIWDETRWQFDETLRAFSMAREICRTAASECNKAKISSMLASAKTIAAVERLARADRCHAATVDQWDADAWRINTADGVFDLRTGERATHFPDDYMTKITGVAPNAGA